jgi:predicted DCC family thiol-disulfide oxidoreductase YuxK
VLLFTVLGFGSLIIELGAPAAMLHKRLGRFWASSAFMMHWGIFFIMGIEFRYQLSGVIFAPFFRVERLATWLQTQKVQKLSEAASRREAVVLFDGVCNFCNGTVQFVLQRDSNTLFKFAPLQSQTATEMLRRFQLPTGSLDTIVLVEGAHVHTKSSAILRILKELSGLWPVLYGFILIPKPIRDFLYTEFAKRRYRLFGKQEHCSLPPQEMKARFLE